ncbi:MAG: hypothetical protein JST00_16205 [Deltaproteobacteria bacterium]|nr:hypothetical protein [Deltaproteobacteria bacterium]
MTTPARSRFLAKTLTAIVVLGGLFACAGADDASVGDDADEEDGPLAGDEDTYASTDEAMSSAGPCSGKPIDRAVRCAKAKGARVLSYYRSAAEQERVRRENGCRNRCSGMAGCVRPTADCTSSPHTRCRAVDLVADGAPVSRAELRKCGLAKTSLPHKNHYDYVGN